MGDLRYVHYSNSHPAIDCRAVIAKHGSELPHQLRGAAEAFGPMPRRSLAALVDLGLTDREIGRYHALPRNRVSELRSIWGIHSDIQSATGQ